MDDLEGLKIWKHCEFCGITNPFDSADDTKCIVCKGIKSSNKTKSAPPEIVNLGTKSVLTIADSNITFPRIASAVNSVFGTNAVNYYKCYFQPKTFVGTKYESNYVVWFPLSPDIRDNEWFNTLDEPKGVITQKPITEREKRSKRITFWGELDKFGCKRYRFVGIFDYDKDEDGTSFYNRVGAEVDIIKPKV